MKRFTKNRRGMTLIETIIALAVLGIVTVPLLVVFTNAQVVIRNTQGRLETNAVMRIIKENVTRAVKYEGGNKISSYEGAQFNLPNNTTDPTVDIWHEGKNLEVKGQDGKTNDKYKFDAKRTKDSVGDAKNTWEYEITLKKMDGQEIQKLTILVNRLESQ